MPTISTKFTLDGEKAYKAAISDINSGLKVLKSEMNLVAAEYKGNEKSMEALTAKSDVLERQYLSQAEKVDTLRKALDRAVNEYGEADKRTQQWRVSLNNAQAELSKLGKDIDENNEKLANNGAEMTGLGDVIDALADKAGINLPDGLTKAANGLGTVNTKALAVAGGIGAAIAAIVKIEKALIDMTKEAAEAAKQLELLSSSTNLSIEAAQEWDYVLQNVGSSLEEAQGDLSALQEKMMEAAKGEGEAAELFTQLGINVMDASGKLKDTDTVMRELVSAMQMMDDETQRNAISSALLGGTGEKLTALYEQEGDAINELINEKRKIGVVSEEEIKKLNEVSDAMLKLEQSTDAAKTKIAAEFAPYTTEALEDVTELVQDLGEAANESGIVDTFGDILVSVTSLLNVLGNNASPVLKTFNSLLEPIALLMAGIADSANVVASALSGDWEGVKTALGWNINKGQLSTIQQILYRDYGAGEGSGFSYDTIDNPLGTNASDANQEFLNSHIYDPKTGTWIEKPKEDWMLKFAGNATGTDNWRGGWTWVGENGPELMRLPQGSQVMNSQESRDYGGDTYNITIDAKSVKEFEDIVRIVQNQRRLRRMEG